jgi:hypothetical protein
MVKAREWAREWIMKRGRRLRVEWEWEEMRRHTQRKMGLKRALKSELEREEWKREWEREWESESEREWKRESGWGSESEWSLKIEMQSERKWKREWEREWEKEWKKIWLSLQLFLQCILLAILSPASMRVPVWKRRLKSVSVCMPWAIPPALLVLWSVVWMFRPTPDGACLILSPEVSDDRLMKSLC